jgi:hypothetical protein
VHLHVVLPAQVAAPAGPELDDGQAADAKSRGTQLMRNHVSTLRKEHTSFGSTLLKLAPQLKTEYIQMSGTAALLPTLIYHCHYY